MVEPRYKLGDVVVAPRAFHDGNRADGTNEPLRSRVLRVVRSDANGTLVLESAEGARWHRGWQQEWPLPIEEARATALKAMGAERDRIAEQLAALDARLTAVRAYRPVFAGDAPVGPAPEGMPPIGADMVRVDGQGWSVRHDHGVVGLRGMPHQWDEAMLAAATRHKVVRYRETQGGEAGDFLLAELPDGSRSWIPRYLVGVRDARRPSGGYVTVESAKAIRAAAADARLAELGREAAVIEEERAELASYVGPG